MSLIYEPNGKAREYSPLALNIYSGGCDHACKYCYCDNMQKAFGRPWGNKPLPRNLTGIKKEADKSSRQILLSFVGDPYCEAESTYRATRKALAVLASSRCSVAILTKGGVRCMDDLAVFQEWPDGRIKVGATLTFLSRSKSMEWEPGAASPGERLSVLDELHKQGVKTWASIEPVIDPSESLAVIKYSLSCVDAYKIGKLNHIKNSTDWSAFGIAAVNLVRSAGRKLYVKDDLRPFLPKGFLSKSECNPETVFLPDRPIEKELF
jgi:DNA repair photolyase